MKIISVRKGFTADHSSTSYEFLAIDDPLNQEEIDEVSSLSSRTKPDDRAASFFIREILIICQVAGGP